MRTFETKLFTFFLLCCALLISLRPLALATSFDSTNFSVKDPVLDQGQNSSSSSSFGIGQSINQPGIGKSTSANFQLLSGFQYYYKVTGNTLTATASSGGANLSWTVPTTYLGINIAGYEVGTGTTSGVYTYEDVGNVTTFSKTGLNNGTQYFLIIKAKGSGNIVLAYSNEATATPVATVTPGGGGGVVPVPPAVSKISFSGLAAPKSEVVLLQDYFQAGKTTSDQNGFFTFSVAGGYSTSSNFVIFYTDPQGVRSNPQSFIVPANQNPSFQNILLPPTLTGGYSQIKQGGQQKLFGFGAPNAKVLIEIFPSSTTKEATTSLNGYYSLDLDTADLPTGEIQTRATLSLGESISKPSFNFNFYIGKETVTYRPKERCGDHNQDGRVDIVDFSILLYWYEKAGPPAKIDCNQDRTINIYDISILMFNWTG